MTAVFDAAAVELTDAVGDVEDTDASVSPDVSVVLSCYSERRIESIRAALRSLAAQTHKPREVIVAVDNNPALAAMIAGEFGGVTVVRNDGSRGASATRNVGARSAATSLIAFLDDDEIAEPTWLVRLIGPFHDADVVGTGGKYEPAWPSGKPSWFPDEFAWAVGGSYRGMPERTERVRNVWSGNMAVRRSAFDAVSGFRTQFGKKDAASQPEDTELCIRLAAHSGGHWMYVPEAVIHHDVPTSRATVGFFVARCYSEGAGKAAMRAHLGSGSVEHEHAFVRRALGAAARRLASANLAEVVQALMMLVGIASAGTGFVAARLRFRHADGGTRCA